MIVPDMATIPIHLAGVLLMAAVAAGCAGSGALKSDVGAVPSAAGGATTSDVAEAPDATITISDMASATPIAVTPGAVVAIVNADGVEHSVTSRPESAFDVHVDGGQTTSFTAPAKPGEYRFYCTYHPAMTAFRPFGGPHDGFEDHLPRAHLH